MVYTVGKSTSPLATTGTRLKATPEVSYFINKSLHSADLVIKVSIVLT